jgi:hypothetical protein
MKTKESKSVNANSTTAVEKKPIAISLIGEKEYKVRSEKSGNPLLSGNVATRMYSNTRVNGTTLILIAALSASGIGKTGKKEALLPEYEEGIKNLRADNFRNEFWKRLETNYKRGENRSSSPALKIGPVLTALRREITSGAIKGFNIAEIADESTRRLFGFNF